MTGRYLIHTPVESWRDERRFDRAWGDSLSFAGH